MVAVTEDDERRIVQYDREVQELQGQLKLLEDELGLTRRKLEAAPRRIHALEKRLAETAAELETSRNGNERLSSTLREARDQLVALKEEVEKLSQPPCTYGVFIEGFEEESTADVFSNGRKMRVHLSPEVKFEELRRGQEVMLNEALNI
ncbi:MAG TPA: proteasome ATPase, partial [Actinomycetota bacterium]|nr:proteasome ATPase [Actinomycetota bacterium]